MDRAACHGSEHPPPPPDRPLAARGTGRKPWHILGENGWRILTENLHGAGGCRGRAGRCRGRPAHVSRAYPGAAALVRLAGGAVRLAVACRPRPAWRGDEERTA